MFSFSQRFHSLLIAPLLLPLLFFAGSSSPNDPPAPIDTSYTAHGNLYGSFPFSQPIRIVSTGQVSHGELRVFGPFNGFSQDSFIYLPNDGYVGADSFTYHACDSSGNCVDGTIDVTVVNNPPNAVDDHYTVHGTLFGGGDTPLTVNDSDPDGDPIRIVSVTSAAHGTLNYVFSTDSFVYSPNQGFTGTDTATYKLCDSLGLCSTATVTFNVVNQAPVAKADNYTIQVNQTLSADGPDALLANDSDPDGDPFSVTAYTQPSFGTLTYSTAEGVFTYQPSQDFVGQDSFTYTDCDYLGACATGTATIKVEGPTPTPTPTPLPTATPPPPPPPPSPSPTPKPTPREPVIFVPGIAGSALNTGSGENIWLGGIAADRTKLTLDPSKFQYNIVADDALRSPTILGRQIEIYTSLLGAFRDAGYVEYQVAGNPSRRTSAGCDRSQKKDDPSQNPSLFVFAYDWRRSISDDLAPQLADYVQCVRTFYPGGNVNIVAHSMGGLVARRYILQYPNTHSVNKLITIATPWLGAPKAINTLETGQFFANPFLSNADQPGQAVIDYLLSDTMKELVKFFPGAHQIIPSHWYYDLGGRPFAENKWDINGNGRFVEDYNPDQLTALLDQRFPLTPGTTARVFHQLQGQDDWRNDSSGVQYFHIYGEQKRNTTIGQVVATAQLICTPFPKICVTRNTFVPVRTNGDGTVPLLSARRVGVNPRDNLNFTKYRAVVHPTTQESDFIADHTLMTQQPIVQKQVLDWLRSPSSIATTPPARTDLIAGLISGFSKHAKSMEARSIRRSNHRTSLVQASSPATLELDDDLDVPHDPSYYVNLIGTGPVTVIDTAGHANTPLDDIFAEAVPGVEIDPMGNDSFQVVSSTSKEYAITFRSSGAPVGIEVVKGETNLTPTKAIRYKDVSLPIGVAGIIRFSSQGVDDLRYDSDGAYRNCYWSGKLGSDLGCFGRTGTGRGLFRLGVVHWR